VGHLDYFDHFIFGLVTVAKNEGFAEEKGMAAFGENTTDPARVAKLLLELDGSLPYGKKKLFDDTVRSNGELH
jgi:hypothetical protein